MYIIIYIPLYMTGDGSISVGKRGNRERWGECETGYLRGLSGHLLGLF